ncbi:hypothetical protein C8R43DRAFT_974698 [Mycena crocata]|nr:hypothetical protein C8R43DRAFT_974698 [Mycena crocata]
MPTLLLLPWLLLRPRLRAQHSASTATDDSPAPPLRPPSFHSLPCSAHATVRNTMRLLPSTATDDSPPPPLL